MKRPALWALFLLLSAATRVAAQQPPDSLRTPQTGDFLQPGDVVRLWIWREEDMSGDYPVDQNGEVVFPKIGVVKVTGIAPPTLKERLQSSYARYLRDPSMEVRFLRRVRVSGQVMKPGLYHIDPTQSVADALVLAGGVAPDGAQDRIELRRDGKVIDTNTRQSATIAESAIHSGDQLYVPLKSWSSRHTDTITAIATTVASLLTTIAIVIVTR
jgi:polysaccharide export outer membrane protein